MAELRWVFHAGWPSRRPPAGVVMVRADTYASTDSNELVSEVLECVVTILAPEVEEGHQTGASQRPATGSRSGSDPVAASEKEHTLHRNDCTPVA